MQLRKIELLQTLPGPWLRYGKYIQREKMTLLRELLEGTALGNRRH
jgi:hypothetical protein